MKKITIIYKGAQEFRKNIEIITDKVYYGTHYGFKEIGYYKEGAKRKTWHPIGGKIDETNDYSETELIIEDI
jgi:hypothetical protein